jgi:hypothetical protein
MEQKWKKILLGKNLKKNPSLQTNVGGVPQNEGEKTKKSWKDCMFEGKNESLIT